MIRIIIADDQVLLRQSIGQLISIDEEISVVDMVGTGKEAIKACDVHQPDMVLMDIEMPEMDGIAALKHIKLHYKNIKVIMLTTFEDVDNIVESIIADADGYMIKDIGCDALITTIKCVNNGLTVIHKSVKEIVMRKFRKMMDHHSNYSEIINDEEIRMVKQIVRGKSNREIGKSFSYSEGTIKNKISRIYEKLGISDRLQLAIYAVENGIE